MRSRVYAFLGLVLLIILFTLQPACDEDPPLLDETVSQPAAPAGDSTCLPGDTITLVTGGATSSLGHAVQYRFDLDAGGNHDLTDWSYADSVAASWPDSGLYAVVAQARCAEHTSVESPWSTGKVVAVGTELVTIPDQPVIDGNVGGVGLPTRLCTGGSTSDLGHVVEYQFDFDAAGAGALSAWDTASCVNHSFPTVGQFEVRARARCSIHNWAETPWSESILVEAGAQVLPEIHFATHIRAASTPYEHADVPRDTVGVMEPFSISYHGTSTNGQIIAYKYYPLTAGVTIPGQDVWYEDITDTTRTFLNQGQEMLPSGVFRLAAQCRDEILAESPVDAGTRERGVCQVVVNFDPDTRINNVYSSYTIDSGVYQREINFRDDVPDTVSYDSWLRIDYQGWDDPRDSRMCPPTDPNDCMGFQVAYYKESQRVAGATEFSLWQPRTGIHDTDPFSAADSNTFSIGSLEYELFARAVDEHGRPDGTPPSVDIIGNFDPVMDSLVVEDHLGNQIDLSITDEMTWNFWKGEGWPYQCECDTVAKPQNFCDFDVSCGGREFPDSDDSFDFYKSWHVRIRARGHDHPMDPPGSGVKAWQYLVQNSQGQFIALGKSLAGFFDGAEINVLDDRSIRWVVYYPGPFTTDPDPYGDTVFDNLPSWLDDDLTFFVIGRDTRKLEGEYTQSIFINGQKSIINVFPASSLGRWTEERVFTFRIRLVR
jgi:hypothetical protein